MCLPAHSCVWLCVDNIRQTERLREHADLEERMKCVSFTNVIRIRPPIGMKRSLIKSESGRGAAGWRSIARGKNPNGTMFLNEVIGVLLD